MRSGELTLQQLLRCQHVLRWHIVRTNRQQTLAEHQWGVCMIAMRLRDKLMVPLSASDFTGLILWALMHDTPEVLTGDLPAPTSHALGDALHAMERGISREWGERRDWAKLTLDGLPATIVKMADTIEAIAFLHMEGVGDFTAAISSRLKQQLQQQIIAADVRHPDQHWLVALEVLQEATHVDEQEAIASFDALRAFNKG